MSRQSTWTKERSFVKFALLARAWRTTKRHSDDWREACSLSHAIRFTDLQMKKKTKKITYDFNDIPSTKALSAYMLAEGMLGYVFFLYYLIYLPIWCRAMLLYGFSYLIIIFGVGRFLFFVFHFSFLFTLIMSPSSFSYCFNRLTT